MSSGRFFTELSTLVLKTSRKINIFAEFGTNDATVARAKRLIAEKKVLGGVKGSFRNG